MNKKKKILLVCPEFPFNTFWGFYHIMHLINKKASFPPLGLLTIASMLPEAWEKRLVDMNVNALSREDIEWAEYVLIGAMIAQRESAKDVIRRCRKLGKKVIMGGPLLEGGCEEFEEADHFLIGEAESIISQFLEDLEGENVKRVYSSYSKERPKLTETPVPMWSLINVNDYVATSLQCSRGCPYDCEFCGITAMHGRVPRLKTPDQVTKELDAIYKTGFRGTVFINDDNLIGNKRKFKKILSAINTWQKEKNYPFAFLAQVSLSLANDEELIKDMVEAGFKSFFIGLETPNKASLVRCNKTQNKSREEMVVAVKKIKNCGGEVLAGLIVGIDEDPESVFEDQINFIQELGVPIAMVGILTALPKARLHERLEEEGRLRKATSGDNTDGSLNFDPIMDEELLLRGYLKIIQTIYSQEKYYERIITFLKEYRLPKGKRKKIKFAELKAFFLSVWYLGIIGDSKKYYWKLMAKVVRKYPRTIPIVIGLTVKGIHFRKVVQLIAESQSFPVK